MKPEPWLAGILEPVFGIRTEADLGVVLDHFDPGQNAAANRREIDHLMDMDQTLAGWEQDPSCGARKFMVIILN